MLFAMLTPSDHVIVKIVGFCESWWGHSCKKHACCGEIVKIGVVLKLQCMKTVNRKNEIEKAI